MRPQKRQGGLWPFCVKLAVSINELHIGHIGSELLQAPEARITRPRRGKRNANIQFDYVGPISPRPWDRAVTGTGVDINKHGGGRQGRQALPQALSFVAPNRNRTEPQHLR